MKEYTVTIPIAGAIHVTVRASDETAATAKAWERINTEGEKAGDIEWEYFSNITEGNVLYAPYNEVEVNEY